MGHLLDHDFDDLAQSSERLITFEQRTLLTLTQAISPVMRAVFHRLEGRFDTRTPTLLPMDEFAVLAAIPDFAQQGKEWLMTRAKKNVSLGFATHSLAQLFGAESDNTLGALMLEGCATKFLLPNPAARTPQMAAIYRRLGFNDAEIQLISAARPQRDIYYSAELVGKRLYSLHLSPADLSDPGPQYAGGSRADGHDSRRRKVVRAFAAAWLTAKAFLGPPSSCRRRCDMRSRWLLWSIMLLISCCARQSVKAADFPVHRCQANLASQNSTHGRADRRLCAVEAVIHTASGSSNKRRWMSSCRRSDLAVDLAEIDALVREAQAPGL